jgi:hypothetical protein
MSTYSPGNISPGTHSPGTHSPASLGHAENVVVDQTFSQRWSLRIARSSLVWAFVNLILALLLYLEMSVLIP